MSLGSNGNITDWSPIRSVIIRVITKFCNHTAGVWFVYHRYDYRLNWTTWSLITNYTQKLPIHTTEQCSRLDLTKEQSRVLRVFKSFSPLHVLLINLPICLGKNTVHMVMVSNNTQVLEFVKIPPPQCCSRRKLKWMVVSSEKFS